jgi:hypothetical protein
LLFHAVTSSWQNVGKGNDNSEFQTASNPPNGRNRHSDFRRRRDRKQFADLILIRVVFRLFTATGQPSWRRTAGAGTQPGEIKQPGIRQMRGRYWAAAKVLIGSSGYPMVKST